MNSETVRLSAMNFYLEDKDHGPRRAGVTVVCGVDPNPAYHLRLLSLKTNGDVYMWVGIGTSNCHLNLIGDGQVKWEQEPYWQSQSKLKAMLSSPFKSIHKAPILMDGTPFVEDPPSPSMTNISFCTSVASVSRLNTGLMF